MKRPNLTIIGIEEGIEIQTKGMNILFIEIISEKFPKLTTVKMRRNHEQNIQELCDNMKKTKQLLR